MRVTRFADFEVMENHRRPPDLLPSSPNDTANEADDEATQEQVDGSANESDKDSVDISFYD